MSLIKRTIVLSDKAPKGYVTFIRVGNDVGVKIVGESFTTDMKAYIKIGDGSVIKGLNGKRTETEPDLAFENSDEVGCVVFDKEIIAVGGKVSEREKKGLFEVKEEREESEPVISEKEEEPVEITEEKKENEESKKKPTEEEELLRRLGEGKENFYIGISDKVEELFVVYPKEEKLSALIPDSEWVRINYSGEDYYVVGKLSDEGKVKYLGYGVPGEENVKPPKIADGIANWFPVSGLSGYAGYWLFFQDAYTGKIEG